MNFGGLHSTREKSHSQLFSREAPLWFAVTWRGMDKAFKILDAFLFRRKILQYFILKILKGPSLLPSF